MRRNAVFSRHVQQYLVSFQFENMQEDQTDEPMPAKPSEEKGQDLLPEGFENETRTISNSDIDEEKGDDENSTGKTVTASTAYNENVKVVQLSDETALSFPQRVSTRTVMIVVCVDDVCERLDLLDILELDMKTLDLLSNTNVSCVVCLVRTLRLDPFEIAKHSRSSEYRRRSAPQQLGPGL
jgi:hypothetical protein